MAFEDLEVWKRAARLSVNIYAGMAENRDYGFRDQITRSGLSVPSNIAEGVERSSGKDCLRFIDIARGSCAELRTQIYIGMEIGYIARETGKQWLNESREIAAMLMGFANSLKRKINH